MNSQNIFSDTSDAINISSSCFVFASAGSGKTKILIDRLIKSLFLGIQPCEILCLTFTNAATFEMRSRIAAELEKLYLNENQYTEKYLAKILNQKYISQQNILRAENLFFEFQDSLQDLNITTIHAFCQNLLQKFPMEAEINPNFEIINENKAIILLYQAKQNILAHLSSEQLEIINSHMSMSMKNFEDLLNSVISSSTYLNDFFAKHDDILKYQTYLETIFSLKKQQSLTIEQQKLLQNIIPDYNEDKITDFFLTKKGTIRKNINSPVSIEIVQIILSNNVNYKKENTIKKTICFLGIAKIIYHEYESLKTAENVLDFADVLFKTEFLLTKSYAKEFIFNRIICKIKSIMIDEAQDLSAIQWRLIEFFSKTIFMHEENQNTIFVVGDVKQSIYKFQGANHKILIEFYQKCIQKLKILNKPCKTIYLNKCYRSLPAILQAVDAVFSGENGKFAFGNQSYINHTPHRQENHGCVEFIEHTEICPTILELIKNKNIKPEEIMILTRSRNDFLTQLYAEMQKNNIKTSEPNKTFIANELIIMDVLAIIDICIDTNNEYSLCCLLKSPYIFEHPLSNIDLFLLCNQRIFSVFDNLKKCFFSHWQQLAIIIKQYYKHSIPDFLFYLIIKVLRFYNASDRNLVNILFAEATKFCESNHQDGANFIQYIRTCAIETSQQNQNSTGIKISTIHGAKGLEAKIVFLLDFSLNVNKAKIKFILDENDFFLKPNENDSFLEANTFINEEYNNENKEILRILYVAMTRAKDILYIVNKNNKKDSAYNLIFQALANQP